jgi:hypothetical protein
MTHHRKIDLSMFRDDDEDDLVIAPKAKVYPLVRRAKQRLTTVASSRIDGSEE